MPDQNDLNKPDLGSSYNNEVLETLRGHIARLWTGTWGSMAGVVNGMLRWEIPGGNVLRLWRRNGSGTDDLVFDSTSLLGDGTVTTAKLANGAVTTAKLADASVITAKLADGSVTTAKLADASVITAKLADGSVTTAKLADASVITAKLADGAASGAKLGSKIQSISASVSGNALTISASSLSLDFRSTTLGSGTVTTVTGTPANLVIPSGATLGTVNGVQSDLVVLAINNAGTIELAVVNLAGGVRLDETNLINTGAVNAGSNNSNIVYSTTSRTNVAYRVIGLLRSTQATAGTWVTAPSLIQGYGGNGALQTLFSAQGAAPMYACRAWVNFSGVGTVTVRASGNVSSITDNGTGDYTVNFTNSMLDTEYAQVGSTQRNTSANATGVHITCNTHSSATARSTGSVRVVTSVAGTGSEGGAPIDCEAVYVAIFR